MPETVIAVLITQDGSSTLEETVYSLRSQSRAVDSLVAVNIGDAKSARAVCDIVGDVPIENVSNDRQISAAIGELARREVARQEIKEPSDRAWIWIAVDGTVIKQDALAEMMAAAEKSPSVRVAGAKQVSDKKILYDVGLTTSYWANPVTLIDDGESDQGQYDSRTDVLGVSFAGMLVEQQTWEKFDGMDSNLPLCYQSLDFCWRVHLGGDRVVVVPSAVVCHRRGGDKGIEGRNPSGTVKTAVALEERCSLKTHPAYMSAKQVKVQRYGEAYLRLKNAPPFTVPFFYCGLIAGVFFRLLGNLVLKNLKFGWGQFLGAAAVVLRPDKIFSARRNTKKTRCVSRSVIKNLQASNLEVWNYRRDFSPTMSRGSETREEEQPTGEALADAAHDSPPQVKVSFGLPLVVVLSALLSLGSIINFYGAHAIGGGASLPISNDLAELWHNATTRWVGSGIGFSAYPHPFAAVLWIFGLLGLGNANIVAVLLFMFSGPVAAAGMWFLSGALTRRYFIRFSAAILWSIAPVHGAIIAQGRLNSLIVFASVPWIALALARAAGASRKNPYAYSGDYQIMKAVNGSDGRASWTAAAAAGLGLALITACVPALFLPAVVAVIVAAAVLGRRGAPLWWSIVPSLAVYIPYIWSFRGEPRALVADPAVPVSTVPIPLWQQILGFADYFKPSSGVVGLDFLSDKLPTVPWALLVALCITLPVILLAVAAAVLRTERAAAVRALWAAVVLFLVATAVCPLIVFAVGRETVVTPWGGNFVIIIYLLLLCAAIIGADALGYRKNIKEYESQSHRKILFVPLTLLLAALVSGGTVFFIQQFVAPAEALSGSPDDAGAARLAADNRQEAVSDIIPTIQTEQLGSKRWAQRANGAAVPVIAADFGGAGLRTKTLVINAAADQPLAASLMRGSGDTLDTVHPIASASTIREGDDGTFSVEYDDVDSMIRNVVAALASGNEAGAIANHLTNLGIGFVVLRGQPSFVQPMARALDAASVLSPVGLTSHGWLWQVKGLRTGLPDGNGQGGYSDNIAQVRLTDRYGNTIGTIPATYQGVRTRTDIPEDAAKIVMAERFSPSWEASFNGRQLRPAEGSGLQEFFVDDHGSGQLTISVKNSYDWIVGSVIVLVFGITLLLAVPVRTRVPEAGASALRRDRKGRNGNG